VKQLAWVSVNDTNQLKWKAKMENVYYNRSEFAGIIIDDGSKVDDGFKNLAVFDSFYPGINLPVIEWQRLYQREQKLLAEKGINLKCNFQSSYTCFFEGKCQPQHFATFAFNFVSDRAYIVQPKDYLISTTNKNGQEICQIGIQGNKLNPEEYILGDLFMQQFYTIFDYANYKFAINGIYTPTSEIKEFGFRDPEANNHQTPGNTVIFVVIAAIVIVLAVVAIIGCVIVRVKNRRLEANLAKYETL
jgi:hypothetical protein